MLDKLKEIFGGKPKTPQFCETILAPVAGEAVPLSAVPDATFSEEMLGKGAAIIPTSGRIVSPINGKVLGIFRTCHAVTLQSAEGAEILIHIGIDTVKLGGAHFTPHVAKGDMVKAGDLLIEVDLAAVKAEGYNLITPVLVCNVDEYKTIAGLQGQVGELDPLINLAR